MWAWSSMSTHQQAPFNVWNNHGHLRLPTVPTTLRVQATFQFPPPPVMATDKRILAVSTGPRTTPRDTYTFLALSQNTEKNTKLYWHVHLVSARLGGPSGTLLTQWESPMGEDELRVQNITQARMADIMLPESHMHHHPIDPEAIIPLLELTVENQWAAHPAMTNQSVWITAAVHYLMAYPVACQLVDRSLTNPPPWSQQ